MGDVSISVFHQHLTLANNLAAMSTSELKLNLLERLILVQDNGLLRRVKALLDNEEVGTELTDEDVAELEAIRARVRSGEEQGYSMQEALRIAREALGK